MIVTACMICDEIAKQRSRQVANCSTYPEDRLIILNVLLDLSIHPVEMPPNDLPADTDAQTLPLLDLCRAQTCKVFEVFRVQKCVRVIFLHKQTGEGLCRFGMFRRQGSNDLRGLVNTR